MLNILRLFLLISTILLVGFSSKEVKEISKNSDSIQNEVKKEAPSGEIKTLTVSDYGYKPKSGMMCAQVFSFFFDPEKNACVAASDGCQAGFLRSMNLLPAGEKCYQNK